MLESAPAIEAILPNFRDFLGNDVLVGHNINFDINFIYDYCELLGMDTLANDFIDTMRLGRRVFPELPNHKLDTICDRCSVPNDSAHRASSDCQRTQACYSYISKYVKDKQISFHTISFNALSKSLHAETDQFSRDSQIYGKTFAFTGKLELYTRREAMQAVLNAGGFCSDGVTSKTNFLVLGNNDYCKAIKDGKSSKQKKAENLQLQGYDITTISESVFLEMVREAQENMEPSSPCVDEPSDDQITLLGFEPPHALELSAYQELFPQLSAAAASMGGSAKDIEIKHGKTYSSVWYGSVLAFRLRLRDGTKYIEVPIGSKGTVAEIAPPEKQKEVAGGFWRVIIGKLPLADCSDSLCRALQDAINRLPKGWDCCSRYMECSDAKRCVHPDPTFALSCGYRKILASGKIYYGTNRNV